MPPRSMEVLLGDRGEKRPPEGPWAPGDEVPQLPVLGPNLAGAEKDGPTASRPSGGTTSGDTAGLRAI